MDLIEHLLPSLSLDIDLAFFFGVTSKKIYLLRAYNGVKLLLKHCLSFHKSRILCITLLCVMEVNTS